METGFMLSLILKVELFLSISEVCLIAVFKEIKKYGYHDFLAIKAKNSSYNIQLNMESVETHCICPFPSDPEG